VPVDAMSLVGLDAIRAAAARIRPAARYTPIIEAPPLLLKCENLQPVGSFKIRGAYNMLAQLPAASRAAGVITYSSGNHGLAVAWAAARLHAPATVVMPATASRVKVDGIRQLGADVIFAGTTVLERQARAEAEAAVRALTIVPPFDHPWIIAGQGTIGLEILQACTDAAVVYVPIGGGGLIAGIAAAIKRVRSDVRVVGVEPVGAARMSASLAAGQPVTLEKVSSIADGLLPVRPGDLTFAHVQAFIDEVVTIDDEAIAGAVAWLFRHARLVAEPSGAAAVAAALARPVQPATVAVVSGGNVDPGAFARYIAS
jgi:threonine dehydratase